MNAYLKRVGKRGRRMKVLLKEKVDPKQIKVRLSPEASQRAWIRIQRIRNRLNENIIRTTDRS